MTRQPTEHYRPDTLNITVRIPDDFAKRLGSGDLGRRVLEALALEEYRAGRLTTADLSH